MFGFTIQVGNLLQKYKSHKRNRIDLWRAILILFFSLHKSKIQHEEIEELGNSSEHNQNETVRIIENPQVYLFCKYFRARLDAG